ncbi:MAG: hypothetical protein ABJQ14_16090, partial [Hyphomicrobiales bacterium]
PISGDKHTYQVAGQTKRSVNEVQSIYGYVDVRHHRYALPAVVSLSNSNISLRSLVAANLLRVRAM